jgi:hypothetical protein
MAACPKCGGRKLASTPGNCAWCKKGSTLAGRQAVLRKRRDIRLAIYHAKPKDADLQTWYEQYLRVYEATIALGHDLTPESPDGERGQYIAYCVACEGFLVGDPNEFDSDGVTPMPYYGRAYDVVCPGHPPVRAPRRSEMDFDWGTTKPEDEPLERSPVTDDHAWNWADDTNYRRKARRRGTA